MKFAALTMMAVTFFTFSAFSAEVTPAPLPIARLSGLYTFQGNFEVPDIRRQELAPSTTTAGKARIQQLRNEGYTCIAKDAKTMRCWNHWKPEAPPAGVKEAVEKFMNGREIEFTVTNTDPELTNDGPTQEWTVRDPVRLQANTVAFYQVSRSFDGSISLSFPVAAGQPVSTLSFVTAQRLGLTLMADKKESANVVWTYTLLPFFESAP
jgi:hypothetical protein